MKKRTHKKVHTNRTPTSGRLLDASKNFITKFFPAMTSATDSKNLETLHRRSWRLYLKFLAFSLTLTLSLSAPVCAKEASPVPALSKKVVAKEETAAKAEAVPVKRTLEKAEGSVTSVSPTSLAVLYETKGSEEFEIMILFDKKARLEGYKKKSDIQPGDIVRMQYEKAVSFSGEPNESTALTMKSVSLLRRPAENTLTSEEGAT